ncbi:hypothetical protein LMG28614_05637 [Paraburkholderia ultramafica]|uniref:Uncharacterized protein n=2 Tax=Paraburkholderia ultramafica TaxID=1544867 RepID=A0A6S7DDL1_9BURK|nr:hypothetical protein LMG28614_05637 [Paraburkholderia ultramafica]
MPAKPAAKNSRDPETSKSPRQPGRQSIGKTQASQEVRSLSAAKVNTYLQPGSNERYTPDEQQPGNGNVSVKNKAKQVGSEVAKRKTQPVPKRAGLKGVVGYLPEDQVEDLTAIAAAVDFGLTDYVSRLIAEHVAANPELVAKGREMLATGYRAPRRPRRTIELEEENARLRAALLSVNPH